MIWNRVILANSFVTVIFYLHTGPVASALIDHALFSELSGAPTGSVLRQFTCEYGL